MPKIISCPIKALHIIHNSGITGPGKVTLSLCKYFDKKEIAAGVLCPQTGYLPDELRNIGIEIIDLDTKNLLSPANFFRLWLNLKKRGFHIFNIHSGQLNAFSKILGKLLGVPVIIYTEHLSGDNHTWIKNKLNLAMHLLCHSISNSMADKIITVSESARLDFIHRQKISPQKVVTIYNGVDTQQLEKVYPDKRLIRQQCSIPEGALVVGMVARFSREKGHRSFILAAREVLKVRPETKFLLVGEGEERVDIERLITDLGIKQNVVFTGLQEEIYNFISIMDIVVQPSLPATESFGLSIIEAMAMGKPVLVSDISCFKEIMQGMDGAAMFPAGNSSKLAKNIIFLLNEPRLRSQIGSTGKEKVRNFFCAHLMAAKTASVYKETLAEKGIYLKDSKDDSFRNRFL